MANSELINKTYNVPNELRTFLGNSMSYHNMKMTKSRMNKLKNSGNLNTFSQKGGDKVLNWINSSLETDRNAIYSRKKIGMDTGRENQFIKKHNKDKDNTNPTIINGLPKINKGNVSRKIMNNTEVYNESLNNEIKGIIYLMKYLDNNKQIL